MKVADGKVADGWRWLKCHPAIVAMTVVLLLFILEHILEFWDVSKAGRIFPSKVQTPATTPLGQTVAYYLVCFSLLFACLMFVRYAAKPFSITGLRPRWAFIIPTGVIILAVVLFVFLWDESDKNELSFALATVFGVVSVLGLATSGLVLVNIHKVITKEEQLMEEAIELLVHTRQTLTFISLSPNLGYAACIRTSNIALIKRFGSALRGTLKRLGRQQKRDDATNVRMAYCNESDINKLYALKASSLRDLDFFDEDAAVSYAKRSGTLQKEVEAIFEKYKSERFTLKKFRPCRLSSPDEGGADKLVVGDVKNFPSQGMLIADGEKAIILGNMSLLTAEANALTGYMANSPHQVNAIKELSDSYFDIYTQEQKPEGVRTTEEAIGLLKRAERKLTFIALSPNLGYAACIKSENVDVIVQFREALRDTLNRLGRQQKHDDATNVKMAYLNESDINKLYTVKAAALREERGLAEGSGEDVYLKHSKGLQEEVETIFAEYESERFALRKFRPCIGGVGRLAIHDAKCFPPLGVVTVDDKEAILLWHCALLTSEPKVATYIAGDGDEVKFITSFCESYEHLYARD